MASEPSSKQTEAVPGAGLLRLVRPLVWLERAWPVWWKCVLLCGAWAAAALVQFHLYLPPWLHALALLLFTLLFLSTARRAAARHKPLTQTQVQRRLEQANNLPHRPFDAALGRPVNASLSRAQTHAWARHAEAARTLLAGLRLFRPTLSLSGKDPYALRYAVLFLFLGALGVAVADGGPGQAAARLAGSLNPAIGGAFVPERIAYDLWITPPAYTKLPPIVLARAGTDAGPAGPMKVPAGSVLTARVSGSESVPQLRANGAWQDFAGSDNDASGAQTYTVSAVLDEGYEVALRRGWLSFARWPVQVVADRAPTVSFAAPPEPAEHGAVRLDIALDDDYGVQSLRAIVSPTMSMPHVEADEVAIDLAPPAPGTPLPTLLSSAQDLAATQLAGMPVSIKIEATDAAGHSAVSAPATLTLPERTFTHPLALALVSARKKLIDGGDDNREPVANMMATVARQPHSYGGDEVVMMALRSGAVRLVLDYDPGAISAVTTLLWQTALRVEDGALGQAAENLRAAQKDLQEALDRGATGNEIAALADRLQEALARYLSAMAGSMAHSAAQGGSDALMMDDAALMGAQMVGADQLMAMAQELGDLAATGSHDAARKLLQQLGQITEALQAGRHGLTAAQEAALAALRNIREIMQGQKKLIDATFHADGETEENDEDAAARGAALAGKQYALRHELGAMIEALGARGAQIPQNLAVADRAMNDAAGSLGAAAFKPAMVDENAALLALQRTLDDMREDLQAQMLTLPGQAQAGAGNKRDPLGRPAMGGTAVDDGSVTIPDRLQIKQAREILDQLRDRAGDGDRSRAERDYIHRLLDQF